MNIFEILDKSIAGLKKAGIETAQIDAEVLVSRAIGKDRTFLLTHPEFNPSWYQKSRIKKYLNYRKLFKPVAYILKEKEFFGYVFLVNRNVLIPRPESEFLVEEALKMLLLSGQDNRSILDLGTGSGCIAISLLLELQKKTDQESMKRFQFYASDINHKALRIAKKNAKRFLVHCLSNKPHINTSNKISFIHSNLFSNKKLHRKYNLIIANLPYVPLSDLGLTSYRSQLGYEPKSAIFAKDNGASIIINFLNQAKKYLTKNGLILLELDPRNANNIREHADSLFSTSKITIKKDLAGLDRYLIISIPKDTKEY